MVYQQGLELQDEGKQKPKVIYRYWPDNGTIIEKENLGLRINCRVKIKFVCVCVYVRLGMLISQSDDVSISKLGLKVEIRLGEMAF